MSQISESPLNNDDDNNNNNSKHRTKPIPSPLMPHPNPSDPTPSLTEDLIGLSLSSSPVSLLSPLDGSLPSRSNLPGQQQQQQPAPRRTPSSTSLRSERRASTPNLKKRSSTASLRSVRNSGGSTSPRPSLSSKRFELLQEHDFLEP